MSIKSQQEAGNAAWLLANAHNLATQTERSMTEWLGGVSNIHICRVEYEDDIKIGCGRTMERRTMPLNSDDRLECPFCGKEA
jgi:hypothetical protein